MEQETGNNRPAAASAFAEASANKKALAGKQEILVAKIEALLFQYGEPIEIKKISKLLKIKENVSSDAVNGLEQALKSGERGLMLLREGDKVQLVTKPDFRKINDALVKEEFRETLTPASLETLAIIAYLGPLSRPTIDYIRGVNSNFTLRSLLMRGLVQREEGKEKGHLYSYRVSFDFLKHLGIGKIEEMPEYVRFKDILKKFEEQGTQNP